MSMSDETTEKKPLSMQRLALEFVRPNMLLARDVYDQDGTIIIAAETSLTERLIQRLKNWEILSVFVRNPLIELPPISRLCRKQPATGRV